MFWDWQAKANLCHACGSYDYALIPGAMVVKGPPSGHTGIDVHRRKAITTRQAPTALDGL